MPDAAKMLPNLAIFLAVSDILFPSAIQYHLRINLRCTFERKSNFSLGEKTNEEKTISITKLIDFGACL